MIAALLFGLTLLALPAAARAPQSQTTPKTDAPKPSQPPSKPVAQRPDPLDLTPASYVIGPQDQLTITVIDEPDLNANSKFRVDESGGINYPYVGRVQAAGMTIAEFQDRLKTMLEAGYIRHPQLRVDIDQYKSQQVFVMGEVRVPGKITLTGSSMTLLEALAAAGSLTSSASNEISVLHPAARRPAGSDPPTAADQEGDRIRVNMKDLEAVNSVMLRDGDIITVPKAQQFFIQGYVRNSGSFVLDGSLTLEQAVALAGGLTERGTFRGAVASRVVNGKLTDVKLNRNDKVLPGDTIKIGQRLF